MEKKILILASTSFIGKNIKKYFEKKFTNIYYLNREKVDFKNQLLLESYIKDIDPEIVVNCCGIVGSSVKNNQFSNFDILNENIILNTNILNSCKNKNIKKIILFSSYRLFGDDIHENYNEENIEYSKIDYNIGYLTSKKILDTQIKLFMNDYKINIVCLLLTNIFGDFDDFTINSRIVPSIINKINKAKIENKDTIINSNKNILVNLIFVEDISKIVEKCIFIENIIGNVIVFNKNGIYTLEMLTNLVSKLLNCNKNILFEKSDLLIKNNIMKPDLNKFNHFFENFVFTDIEKGLKMTIDNLTNNSDRNII
jgi:nucleoside-diphosphate-sugar epimerase